MLPLVVLATVATVIASQALISGAFSLISQAIGLGLFPRLDVRHTHRAHAGQIYIPFVNWDAVHRLRRARRRASARPPRLPRPMASRSRASC